MSESMLYNIVQHGLQHVDLCNISQLKSFVAKWDLIAYMIDKILHLCPCMTEFIKCIFTV